jgi:hypothetical protein
MMEQEAVVLRFWSPGPVMRNRTLSERASPRASCQIARDCSQTVRRSSEPSKHPGHLKTRRAQHD